MKKILFVLSLLVTLILTGCSGNKEAKNSEKDKNDRPLVVGSGNFNGDFYTGWTNSSYDSSIRSLVWGGGLLTTNEKGEFVLNSIVKERTVARSEGSKEDNIWTFKLKDGLKFSNGNPLTAKDVKFTYDFYMNIKDLSSTGGSASIDQYVDSVTLNEKDNSVTFKLKKVIYTIDTSVFTYYMLDSKTIEAGAKKDGLTVQQWVKSNINKPIGYGPYKIDKYVESQYVKLSLNPYYVGDYDGSKPEIKHLIVQNVPIETQVTQLMSGEIDVLTGIFNEEDINSVKADDGLSKNNYYRHGGGQLTFHCDFGPSQLKEVRQAFAYEIDRTKFRNIFLGKYGIASNAPFSRTMWMLYDGDEKLGTEGAFEKSLKNYDLVDADGNWDEKANISEARRLLDQAAAKTEGKYAKLTKSGDKYLWEGKDLTLNFTMGSQWLDAINLTLTKPLQEKFGIKINITSMDWSIMSSHLYGTISATERKYDVFAGGTSYAIKYVPYANWSKTKILPFGKGSSANSARYVGDEKLLEDMLNASPSTPEGDAQYKKLWREWIVQMNENLPVLPLYSNNYYDAYTNELVDFDTNSLWGWTSAIVKARYKN